MDVYSFMNRIQHSYQGISGMDNLVINAKLKLDNDEALALQGFMSELPGLFGKSITSTASTIRGHGKSSDLPAMPTFKHWEDAASTKGMKSVLTSRTPIVVRQVRHNIAKKLGNYPEGKAIAHACLDGTVTFLEKLSSFMSDTYRMFQESGFAGDVGWHLVTQLVNHIFTDDMAKVRSFVYDAVHADQ